MKNRPLDFDFEGAWEKARPPERREGEARPSQGPKREQILEAAARLFVEQGFHATTVGGIARLAGVGKGTVYEYFSSKEELFRELVRRTVQAYLEGIESTLLPERDAAGTLEAILRFSAEFHGSRRNWGQLLLEGAEGGLGRNLQRFAREVRRKVIARVEAVIAQGIAAGELRPASARLAAIAFVGMLDALAADLLFGEPFDPGVDPPGELLRLFLHGMSPGAG